MRKGVQSFRLVFFVVMDSECNQLDIMFDKGDTLLKRAFCLLLTLFLLCGCTPSVPDPDTDNPSVPPSSYEIDRTQRQLYLTIWSWQIPTVALAEEYARRAAELGFTGIDLCVRWEKIEPARGRFDWFWLDSVTDVFRQKGLSLSLSLLLWTGSLSWADQLAFQQTSLGDVFEYEGRGGSLCLCDQSNLDIVKNTLQAFSIHCASSLGDSLQRWGVRLSCYGELEYSTGADLDYSPQAICAFLDYVLKTYGSYEAFSLLYGRTETTRSELEALKAENFSTLFTYDWKCFKQAVLTEFSALAAGIFHAAAPGVPVAAQIGSWADPLSALYGGILDPVSFLKESGADILHVADADSLPVEFLIDLAVSLAGTGGRVAYEIDGAWKLENGSADFATRAKAVGEAGLFSLNTANWSLEELDTYGPELLSQYQSLFFCEPAPVKNVSSTVLLVNTADFSLRSVPVSLFNLLSQPYTGLKDAGVQVRFVTDRQLLAHPELLEEIETLCLGNLSECPVLDSALVELLLSSGVTLTADRAGYDEVFFNPYGIPFPEEIQQSLRKAIVCYLD